MSGTVPNSHSPLVRWLSMQTERQSWQCPREPWSDSKAVVSFHNPPVTYKETDPSPPPLLALV